MGRSLCKEAASRKHRRKAAQKHRPACKKQCQKQHSLTKPPTLDLKPKTQTRKHPRGPRALNFGRGSQRKEEPAKDNRRGERETLGRFERKAAGQPRSPEKSKVKAPKGNGRKKPRSNRKATGSPRERNRQESPEGDQWQKPAESKTQQESQGKWSPSVLCGELCKDRFVRIREVSMNLNPAHTENPKLRSPKGEQNTAGRPRKMVPQCFVLPIFLLVGCEQIRKTQDEPQWIVAQRLLSALTVPGFK